MRRFQELTCSNLLRKPLVFGVPSTGLLFLIPLVLLVQLLGQGSVTGDAAAAAIAGVGYFGLLLMARFAKTGWDEAILYWFETRLPTRGRSPRAVLSLQPCSVDVVFPDTADELTLIRGKASVEEQVRGLKPGERHTFVAEFGVEGLTVREIHCGPMTGTIRPEDFERLTQGVLRRSSCVYSLYRLPVATDPLWTFSQFGRIVGQFSIVVSVKGVDPISVKSRIEGARKENAQSSFIPNVDSEVSFQEATDVLRGLSRGDECVVEVSMVVMSDRELTLDPRLFVKENNISLSGLSVLGLRSRYHRSHLARAVTAADLIPNVGDPAEEGVPLLASIRGNSLYFDPQDSRLEALHWLVVGATGAGKSFFVGNVLNRMVEGGMPMSVLFIDHNRSFRRLVRARNGAYLESETGEEIRSQAGTVIQTMDQVGRLAGIELSDLDLDERKTATRLTLSLIEEYLRTRRTTHPVYIVMDECWKFLKDEPALVQLFFREFRKLNGAAIAITQSLSDFLSDPSGRSIFQNAPIRVLLRQGEDLSDFRGVLGLNSVELEWVQRLRQEKGRFSECLIKTPYLSRIGRLHPEGDEHELLRTDNLRQELIQEARCEAQV